jgi:4-alpha-glucanotransferase
MNTPAVPSGNWSWRAPIGCFTPALAERLAALVAITDREYDPLGEADPNNDSPFEPANGG